MFNVGADNNGGPSGRGWLPFQQIKLGPGVVGRTAPILVALVVVLGLAIFAVRAYPAFVVGLALLAVLATGGYVWRAFKYADDHPDHAVLDGGELVRSIELQQAAREPQIIEHDAEPVANTAPPAAITNQGDGDA